MAPALIYLSRKHNSMPASTLPADRSPRRSTTLLGFLAFTASLPLPGPLFETHCSYVEASLAHFLSWTQNQAEADAGPFIDYPRSEFWAYADYKYIAALFQDFPSMFEVAGAVDPSAVVGVYDSRPFTVHVRLSDEDFSMPLTTCH